jgi:hypothetical protein
MKRIRFISLLLVLCLFGFAGMPGQLGIANEEKPNISQIFPEVQDYIMSEIPFEWKQIGNPPALPAEPGNSILYTLPFSFKFYDEVFTEVYISKFGYLSFWTDEAYGDNQPFPLINPAYSYMIAPFWDSFIPRYCITFPIQICIGGGHYYVQNFLDFVVVEWKNIRHFPEGGGSNFPLVGTFQVILKDSGDIIFNYDYLDYIDPQNGYTCGLNYGYLPGAYNTYSGLNSNTEDFSLLFTQITTIPATIDFDPDTLNPRSKGKWVTVYIDLPQDYDVNDINLNSIELITSSGTVPVEETPTGVEDGTLMVKFDRQEVIGILEPGEEILITVSGELNDETSWEGTDQIRVLDFY